MEQRRADHPAARWARDHRFAPVEIACTKAVVLKILDGKCKMLPAEQAALLAVYEEIYTQPDTLFNAGTHWQIAAFRAGDQTLHASIHALRLFAEAQIPKPLMKRYKALLREALFG